MITIWKIEVKRADHRADKGNLFDTLVVEAKDIDDALRKGKKKVKSIEKTYNKGVSAEEGEDELKLQITSVRAEITTT